MKFYGTFYTHRENMQSLGTKLCKYWVNQPIWGKIRLIIHKIICHIDVNNLIYIFTNKKKSC